MALINFTDIDASNNLVDMLIAFNGATNNALGYIILFAVFLITLMITGGLDKKTSFVYSSFVTLLVSIGLFFMEMISLGNLSIPLILFLGSFVISAFDK